MTSMLIRTLAGLLIAAIISVVVFFIGINIGIEAREAFPSLKILIDQIFPFLLFISVGFFGIYFGSLCFPRVLRAKVSIMLLIVGLIVNAGVWLIYTSWTHMARDYSVLPVMSISLIAGGSLVAFIYRYRGNTAEQGAAANP